MSENTNASSDMGTGQPRSDGRRARCKGRLLCAGVAVALLAVGITAGAGASHYVHAFWPRAVLLLQPTAIARMQVAAPVAIKGQVAEIFGNKFVVQDDTGRALVDTGPSGVRARPMSKGEAVTVQGRFAHGYIHAEVMTRADGTSEAFGPPPHHHHGPDRGPGRAPPPHPGL